MGSRDTFDEEKDPSKGRANDDDRWPIVAEDLEEGAEGEAWPMAENKSYRERLEEIFRDVSKNLPVISLDSSDDEDDIRGLEVPIVHPCVSGRPISEGVVATFDCLEETSSDVIRRFDQWYAARRDKNGNKLPSRVLDDDKLYSPYSSEGCLNGLNYSDGEFDLSMKENAEKLDKILANSRRDENLEYSKERSYPQYKNESNPSTDTSADTTKQENFDKSNKVKPFVKNKSTSDIINSHDINKPIEVKTVKSESESTKRVLTNNKTDHRNNQRKPKGKTEMQKEAEKIVSMYLNSNGPTLDYSGIDVDLLMSNHRVNNIDSRPNPLTWIGGDSPAVDKAINNYGSGEDVMTQLANYAERMSGTEGMGRIDPQTGRMRPLAPASNTANTTAFTASCGVGTSTDVLEPEIYRDSAPKIVKSQSTSTNSASTNTHKVVTSENGRHVTSSSPRRMPAVNSWKNL